MDYTFTINGQPDNVLRVRISPGMNSQPTKELYNFLETVLKHPIERVTIGGERGEDPTIPRNNIPLENYVHLLRGGKRDISVDMPGGRYGPYSPPPSITVRMQVVYEDMFWPLEEFEFRPSHEAISVEELKVAVAGHLHASRRDRLKVDFLVMGGVVLPKVLDVEVLRVRNQRHPVLLVFADAKDYGGAMTVKSRGGRRAR